MLSTPYRYGGIGYFEKGKEWVPNKCHTYLKAESTAKATSLYVNMTRLMITLAPTGLSSAIYTQITDVELECDGFFAFDRTPHFDAGDTARIRAANEALCGA